MCTVSFYRDKSKVIVTSNRDEKSIRPLAIAPRQYRFNNQHLYFPKDPQAGGSWFIVKADGSAFVLLNGAEKKHIPQPPYKKSRGLILLEIADSSHYLEQWNTMDLEQIENFTVIAYANNKLAQLQWNGTTKTHLYLDENKAHIWSSTTLYDEPTIEKRQQWYFDFLSKKNNDANSSDIMDFHTKTQNHDTENGLIINRPTAMLTKNVTQVVIEHDNFEIHHLDLVKNIKTTLKNHRNDNLVAQV